MAKRIISNSSLSLMRECPQCFWLQMNKNIKRPSRVFPSLPGGVDIQIKRRFDDYREMRIVPSEVHGQIPGLPFPNQAIINDWRNWRRGLRFIEDDVEIVGALDECFLDDLGYHYPVDFKTRGYPLKDDGTSYYKDQLDLYTLLLKKNGFRTNGMAYLIYYLPTTKDGNLCFTTEVRSCDTDYVSAERQIEGAIRLLDSSNMPPADEDCSFCNYAELRGKNGED